MRLAALEGLGRIGTKLVRPGAIWSRINDPEAPRVERALCLLALEQTGSVSNVAVAAIVPFLDPFERYFAARCLIASGNVFGVEILLDLLEMSEDQRPTRWRLLERWTSYLMVEVSGISRKQGLPAWREWYQGLEALQPQTLRPALVRREQLQ